MSHIVEVIAGNVKRLREAKKLAQKEICAETGIPQGQYSRIENGKVEPSISTLDKLAKVFEVSISEFFTSKLVPPDFKVTPPIDFDSNSNSIEDSLPSTFIVLVTPGNVLCPNVTFPLDELNIPVPTLLVSDEYFINSFSVAEKIFVGITLKTYSLSTRDRSEYPDE